MLRTYLTETVDQIFDKYSLNQYFENRNLDFEIREYETGEFLCAPNRKEEYIQLVLEGEISIYKIITKG